MKFFHILFKISVVRTKNLSLFSTNWKIYCMCFLNFFEFLLFHWNFLKFFPKFIRNSSSFSKYLLKIFALKICLNIAWECYECTKNVLRISYKSFRNFRTFYKISPIRLEYLINFFKVFLKFPSSYTPKTFIYLRCVQTDKNLVVQLGTTWLCDIKCVVSW